MVFLNFDVFTTNVVDANTVTGSTRVIFTLMLRLLARQSPFETAHLTTDESCARHVSLQQQQPIGGVISRAMI